MQGKFYGGAFGKTPIYGGGVNFGDADVAQVLAAANDLTKTLVSTGSAVIGGIGRGIGFAAKGMLGVGLGILILEVLHHWIEEAKKPQFALGSSPVRIDTGAGVQWGIILNETFPFEFRGQNLEVPFSQVAQLQAGLIGKGPLWMVTIDQSSYPGIIAKEPVIKMVTLAGIQTVKLQHSPGKPLYTSDSWSDTHMRNAGMDPTLRYERFRFIPSKAKDVDQLKTSLEFTLQNNKEKIVDTIGRDTLNQFFKI